MGVPKVEVIDKLAVRQPYFELLFTILDQERINNVQAGYLVSVVKNIYEADRPKVGFLFSVFLFGTDAGDSLREEHPGEERGEKESVRYQKYI